MSFSSNGNSQQPEINVTPLIDVLLVLIIIFMIIVPMKPSGLKAMTPQPALHTESPPPDNTVVLQVQSHAGGEATYSINQQPVEKNAIVGRLAQIFALRQERTIFVKGDAELEFSKIAEVVSFAHQAQIINIGVLTPKSEKGQ